MPYRQIPKQIAALKSDPVFRTIEVRDFAVHWPKQKHNQNQNSDHKISSNSHEGEEKHSKIAAVKAFNGDGIFKLFSSVIKDVQRSSSLILSRVGRLRKKQAEKTTQPTIKKIKDSDKFETAASLDQAKKQSKIVPQADPKHVEAKSDTNKHFQHTDSEEVKRKEHQITVSRPREVATANVNVNSLVPASVVLDFGAFNSQIKLFRNLFVALIILFLAQLVVSSLLLFKPTTVQVADTTQQEASKSLVGLAGEGEAGVRILQDFTVNKGIIDIGSNVKVDKRAISTRQHTNCKTPVPPPEENGCGFTLIPSALGLPLKGVHYQRLTFNIESSGNARLKVDIKNYEKGALSQDLGVWNQADPKPYIQLPKRIENSDGINVRFWTDGGDIVINQIKIEYLTVDQLKQVSLKVGPAVTAKLLPDSIGIIYEDRNRDRLVTPGQDEPWTCKADFPGVKQVKLDEQGSVILLRDDDCYTSTKPDFWYTDDKFGSLPPGDWILVYPAEKIALPFKVDKTTPKATLELIETSPIN